METKMSEDRETKDDCTCDRWPLRGGTPNPKLGTLEGAWTDYEAIDPDCPIHGKRAKRSDDPPAE